MSILQNLKILNKPIAELAMLPQEAIIKLAQSGQIPVGFVAPILGEKAEQTKAGAAAAAMMAQQQMPQPTVLEKIMAENAVGEVQSQLPEDVGIGALPVDEGSLPNEFAGGGIVAFEQGGKVSLSDVLRTLTMDEARTYQRTGRLPPRAQAMLTGEMPMPAAPTPGMGKAGTGPATISMDGPDVAQTPLPSEMFFYPGTAPLIGGQAANVRPVAPPSPSAAVEAIIAQAERGKGPNVSRPSQLPADKQLNRTPKGLAPQDTPFAAPKIPSSEVALVTQEGKKLIPRQGMSVEDFKARQAAFGITDDVDADLRAQIEELTAGSKAEREQAKYMAMLQAGLSIMGGTSPYAFENIAKGAQKGVAQYASDIKDIKKEERDLMKLRGELARAEDARKRGDFKTFQDANDKAQALEISLMNAESTRMTARAQQRLAEARATGSGITPNQMANLRMKAEKEVDPAAVRAAVAKEKKLSKIPKPGENKKFDAAVDAAYEAEIERRVNRALGGATRSSVGTRADLSGYRIVPEDDE